MTDSQPGDPLDALLGHYRAVATRMAQLPVYHAALDVRAVGFREYRGRRAGVIVTPWFMNLVALPGPSEAGAWRAGDTARLDFPSGRYDFVVSEAGAAGLVASCSLFTLMHDFDGLESAVTAAQAAADALFEPEPAPPPAAPKAPPTFSRRKLFGG